MPAFDAPFSARSPIGTGARSPFSFSAGRGIRSVQSSNGLEKLQASIRDILLTRPGERLNQPEYGSRIFDLVFEQNDTVTHRLLHIYASDALRRWERRIRVTATDFIVNSAGDDQTIQIVISYVVLATHETGSYVFPFVRGSIPMDSSVQGVESRGIFAQGTVAVPGTAEIPAYGG